MNENGKTEEIELEETQVIENVEARETAETQAETPKKGWKALSRNAKIGIGAGCAAVLAAVVAGACVWSNQPATLPADEPVGSAQLAEPEEEGAPQKVKIGYEGYEPAEGDTPVIVHVTGTTDGNRSVEYYHAVSGAQEEVALVPGGYSVECLPVLKAGGSLITAKDGAASAVVEDGALASTAPASEKAAEDVTQDDLNNVLAAVKKAVENGDDTLKGAAGKAAVDKVVEAVKATGKVDETKVEEARQEAEAKASEPSSDTNAGHPATTTGSNGNGGSNAGGAASTPASQPTDNGNGGSGQFGSGQPEHVHNWQAVTEQQWVPNNVWMQDSAAWDEQIQTGEIINASCGATFGSVDEWFAHQTRNHSCSYTVVPSYKTVHHDASGHYEDQGHYETVTTGYRCSCGATK